MPKTDLVVGDRVHVRRSIVGVDASLQEDGEVIRVDGRGVLVLLDGGQELLCEPDMLTSAVVQAGAV